DTIVFLFTPVVSAVDLYMASSSSLLSEEQFLCSICLDVFTEPVSIPCGHNFCKACISGYWDTSDLCQCPMCKEKFYRRPELRINTFISEMVAQFRKSVQVKATSSLEQCPAQPLDIPCDFCTGMKLKALKSCLVCLTSYGETHLEPHQRVAALKRRAKLGKTEAEVQEIKHSVDLSKREAEREISDSVQVFTDLVRSIERSQAELIEVIEEKQKAAERQAEGIIKELEQEITELQRRSTELEQLSHTEDHLHLLQSCPSLCTPPPTKDCSEISVHSDLCVGTVRRAVSQVEETILSEVKKLCDAELKRIQQYDVDVTLDPDTAHPKLIMSEDGKQVKHGNAKQHLPDKPVRFSTCLCILGKEGFSSGRFYYEVTVKGKTNWDLGVARESITRKGPIQLKPTNGYWTVWLGNGEQYKALSCPSVLLSLREKPQKVGVFVDYEEGQVSFYDVEARSHIYSFTGCTFTEKLYPYFSPNVIDGGKNSALLIISPVNHKE
uniref:Bloodthirsty-related gene family, member 2 n=1 Tax=Salmo trutta TaxID=8032 RepID=A0A674F287_SALTR